MKKILLTLSFILLCSCGNHVVIENELYIKLNNYCKLNDGLNRMEILNDTIYAYCNNTAIFTAYLSKRDSRR